MDNLNSSILLETASTGSFKKAAEKPYGLLRGCKRVYSIYERLGFITHFAIKYRSQSASEIVQGFLRSGLPDACLSR